jgi:hypothetical protein
VSLSAAEVGWLRLDEPVIVLTCARSGSTLLRFILDAHPQLACPPETGIVDLITRMGMVWKLLDGQTASARQGLTNLALTAIRNWVATAYGAYLAGQGKSRWCDKSLGSAASASRFLDLFPRAKFICLYRHCMDVIDSMLEACPWGLTGYGIDTYTAIHPGNSVAAVADYWVCDTRAIRQFELAHPEQCIGVRYEDLVADPEGESARIFAFVGEQPIPDVASSIFTSGLEHFGPSDHKIWATSDISQGSVNRGARVPWKIIPPPVLALVNDLLEQLNYETVQEGWGERLGTGCTESYQARAPETDDISDGAAALLNEVELLLQDRASSFSAAATVGPDCSEQTDRGFLVTATMPGQASLTWDVDLVNASIARRGETAGRETPTESGRGVQAPAAIWRAVLTGQLNAATAMRQGYLRYSELATREEAVSSPLLGPNPLADLLVRFLA